MALGLGDPALGLEHAPRHVILLGPDQAEDVFLAVIFADQGGREPEPAAGLDVGGDPEHGRRQQMDLVIDDQPPVTLVEQVKVGEVAILLGPVGDDLVGGQRDRPDGLGVAGVGADLRRVDIGLVEDLAPPLCHGRRAGGQHQGLGLERRQGRQAHDRLACATGQYDHTRTPLDVATGVKGSDGSLLVIANQKRQPRQRLLPEVQQEPCARCVSGEVLGRIAHGDQCLLEHAAMGVVNAEAGRIQALSQVIAHSPLPRQLLQQRLILGDQPELAVDPLEPYSTITTHQIAQIRG